MGYVASIARRRPISDRDLPGQSDFETTPPRTNATRVHDVRQKPLRTKGSRRSMRFVRKASEKVRTALLVGSVAIAAADCHLTAPPVGSAATGTSTASQRAWKIRSSAVHIACGLKGSLQHLGEFL